MHDAKTTKNINICSDSYTALNALQAAKTFPLLQQCKKASNNISTQHKEGPYWVSRHAGVQGNEIADKIARDRSVQKFVGPEPSLGVSWQNRRKKKKCWIDNQHLAMWQGVSSTQRQAQKLISGPSPTAKIRHLSFNRIKSRVVTGLLLVIIP